MEEATEHPLENGFVHNKELRRVIRPMLKKLVSSQLEGHLTEAAITLAPGGVWEPSNDFMHAVFLIHRELANNTYLEHFTMRFVPGRGIR